MYCPITPLEPRRHFAAGSVDSTFGDAGKLLANFDPPLIPAGISVLPDGRTLVAARPSESSRDGFRLLRLTRDGVLDSTFSPAKIDFSAPSAVSAIAMMGDLIVLAGSAGSGDNRATAVARLRADGSLDPSFDGDGMLTLKLPNHSGGVGTIAPMVDGRLLLGCDDAVVRIHFDGSLDKSFSGDGIAPIGSGQSGNFVQSMFIDARRRIWAAPQTSGRAAQTLVARFTDSGQLDSTFSGDGRVYISGGDPTDPQIAPLGGDGALLVNIGGFGDAVTLRRLGSDGALDSKYGNNGVRRVVIPGGRPASPRLVGRLPLPGVHSDRIQYIIAGTVTTASTRELDAFVIRLDRNANPDLKFNNGAAAVYDLFHNDTVDALAINEGGQVTLASLSFDQTSNNDFDYRFALTRVDGTNEIPSARITRTGTLLVSGSENDDEIVVERVNDRALVHSGGFEFEFDARQVRRMALYGGEGNDTMQIIRAEIGASALIDCGPGNDSAFGNNQPNIILGGAGNDSLFGLGGDDTIEGNTGNDSIEGGRGDDRLLAGGGADELFGNTGRDTLIGDISEDVLNGGADDF